MCGRFTLTDPDPRILRMRFNVPEQVEIDERPRFNIAPTDPVLAVRLGREGERRLGRLRWGLIPHFAEPDSFKRLLINARAETLATSAAFRDAFKWGRCLIPADGFYEWMETEEGKQPIWITRPGKEPFAFAGLWSRAEREDGTKLHSCAIATCAPSATVRPVHDRMPVILDRKAEEGWIADGADPGELASLLRPTDELELTAVSTAVNNVKNDGPELVEPVEPALKLF
ncbi:MAG: SOS response-associated peptidase [Solirubrobacterales bacterium]|nr:SOS response-associated peptidase [Solirubrobacterales bacterium]